MPVEMKNYINRKLQGIHQEKRKIELLMNKFFQGILHDSMPTMRRYIDDIVMCTIGKQKHSQQGSAGPDPQGISKEFFHQPKQTIKHAPVPSESETELLTKKLFFQDQMELQSSVNGIIQKLTSNLATMCTVNDLNWELDNQYAGISVDKYLQPQFYPIPEEYAQNYSFTDFLKQTLEV